MNKIEYLEKLLCESDDMYTSIYSENDLCIDGHLTKKEIEILFQKIKEYNGD